MVYFLEQIILDNRFELMYKMFCNELIIVTLEVRS